MKKRYLLLELNHSDSSDSSCSDSSKLEFEEFEEFELIETNIFSMIYSIFNMM